MIFSIAHLLFDFLFRSYCKNSHLKLWFAMNAFWPSLSFAPRCSKHKQQCSLLILVLSVSFLVSISDRYWYPTKQASCLSCSETESQHCMWSQHSSLLHIQALMWTSPTLCQFSGVTGGSTMVGLSEWQLLQMCFCSPACLVCWRVLSMRQSTYAKLIRNLYWMLHKQWYWVMLPIYVLKRVLASKTDISLDIPNDFLGCWQD
jgi:hypothetical protein